MTAVKPLMLALGYSKIVAFSQASLTRCPGILTVTRLPWQTGRRGASITLRGLYAIFDDHCDMTGSIAIAKKLWKRHLYLYSMRIWCSGSAKCSGRLKTDLLSVQLPGLLEHTRVVGV